MLGYKAYVKKYIVVTQRFGLPVNRDKHIKTSQKYFTKSQANSYHTIQSHNVDERKPQPYYPLDK